MHTLDSPSPWVTRWLHLVRSGGSVLDVACGQGRHAPLCRAKGLEYHGVDYATEAIANLRARGFQHTQVANLELPNPDDVASAWPFAGARYDAVIVTNYLHRPLFPALLGSLKSDGVLIYETFAAGNETVGKPSRPDFLLQHGELLQRCADLRIVAYEDGFIDRPAFLQRICAVKQGIESMNHAAVYPLAT